MLTEKAPASNKQQYRQPEFHWNAASISIFKIVEWRLKHRILGPLVWQKETMLYLTPFRVKGNVVKHMNYVPTIVEGPGRLVTPILKKNKTSYTTYKI